MVQVQNLSGLSHFNKMYMDNRQRLYPVCIAITSCVVSFLINSFFLIFFLLLVSCALFFTPPRNRGGVIFLLQFVCLSVCACECVSVSVNKIPVAKSIKY